MTNKRYIIGVFVLGALVASAAFVGVSAQEAGGSSSSSGDTIQVSASGQASAEPNKAVINVAVEATATDPNQARTMVASQVSNMRTALTNSGIGNDQIRTTEFSIREQREERRPGPAEGQGKTSTKYVARHEFEIELSTVGRTGEIIDVAVKNGATQVTNVRYTLSEDKRRQIKSEALEDAVANARAQANALARSADVSVGGVRSISTANTGITPVRFEARQVSAGGGGTEIETGPVTVDVNVNVAYAIG